MADKMMRIAGRGTDGTAKAVSVENDGKLLVQIGGSLPDLENTYRIGKVETEIRAAGVHLYYLVQTTQSIVTGDTHTKIPGFISHDDNACYRRWKITVLNKLAKTCTMDIYPYIPVSHVNATGQFTPYMKLGTISVGSGDSDCRKIITSLESGDSVHIITIPELDGIHRDLAFRFTFADAPTEGKLYIAVEAQK